MHVYWSSEDMSSVAPLIFMALWLAFGPGSSIPAVHATALVVLSEILRRTVCLRGAGTTATQPSTATRIESDRDTDASSRNTTCESPLSTPRESEPVTPKSSRRNVDPAFEECITRLATVIKSGSQPSVYLKRADVATLVDKLVEQATSPGSLCITSPALERLSILESNTNIRWSNPPRGKHRARAQSLDNRGNALFDLDATDCATSTSSTCNRTPLQQIDEKDAAAADFNGRKENMAPDRKGSKFGGTDGYSTRERRNTSSFTPPEIARGMHGEAPPHGSTPTLNPPAILPGDSERESPTAQDIAGFTTRTSRRRGSGALRQSRSRSPSRPRRQINFISRTDSRGDGDAFDEYWSVS
ncbi:unnamed protein product [Discosporangium mesarthrocarpum]